MSNRGPKLPHNHEHHNIPSDEIFEMEIEVKCPECGKYLGLFGGLCRETEEIRDNDGNKRTIIRDLIRCTNCDELVLYDLMEK